MAKAEFEGEGEFRKGIVVMDDEEGILTGARGGGVVAERDGRAHGATVPSSLTLSTTSGPFSTSFLTSSSTPSPVLDISPSLSGAPTLLQERMLPNLKC